MTKSLILCDCLGSQKLDRDTIESGTDVRCSRIHSALCTAQAEVAAKAMTNGDAIIACHQEHARFLEIAEEIGVEAPGFIDLRDRAGWSDEGALAGPKQAALVAEALLPVPKIRALDIQSEGLCLILGEADIAMAAADRLAEPLSVTVLLADLPESLPFHRKFDVIAGQLASASGALGGFSVKIDLLRQIEPGGRGGFSMGSPRNGAESSCDIILDFRRAAPLFGAHEKREGYLRADPGNPSAVAEALLLASQMVGTFEKPLYVRLEESLCAHSRAEKIGCTKCLDACPTGAITSAGEHVTIDSLVCAGCGQCSALCPSGAVTSENPPPASLFQRIDTLASTYRAAGGKNPRLLVHTSAHGTEMIALAARFGRGIPADSIPLAIDAVSSFGHAEILASIGAGFLEVDILLSPTTERGTIDAEILLAEVLGGAGRIRVLDMQDPDELSDSLFDSQPTESAVDPILPVGSRRQVTRLVAKALHPENQGILPLPDGAPYGTVEVNTETCTLCLACASLCPAGALGDNPDMPQLRFQEDACLQCGLCVKVCPESAIALKPQFNLSDSVFAQQVVNEEEPFECIECGKPFGVKSMIERISSQLAGKHSMFGDANATRLMQMCDDCRIRAQYHSENNPFAAGTRPKTRTTDDYLSNRKDR